MSLQAEKQSKKRKVKSEEEEEAEQGEEEFVGNEAEESGKSVRAERNEEGDAFFPISAKRRVVVRYWKNKVLVDIREVYEKDGKMLPGKKGISLSEEQYEALRDTIKAGSIDKEIATLKKK